MLLQLDQLVLDEIGKMLPAKDLIRLSITCKALREFYNKETYYQALMGKQFWIDRKFFRYQDDLRFVLNNVPSRLHSIEQFGQKNIRYVAFSHDGSMMALFANGCRIWVFRGDEEILHAYLSRKRGWDKVVSMEFSPDDCHLLVTGCKEELVAMARGNEALIYKLGEDYATLRSFINLDQGMFSTWFDNQNVMFTQNFGIRDRMRLFISTIDMAADILVYPVLTFDTRITGIMVAQHVSPRTRKITQIADQAQEEGKTLTEKLIEIGLESGVDVTNMQELRAILDQESQCMPCYRLHSHHDAVSQRECQCHCHHNTDRLLVFHGNDERVHVKVITERILERAKQAWRVRGEDDEDIDQNRLFFPLALCNVFDTVDHVFRTGLSLARSSMCFSPDHRYLYITETRKAPRPRDPIMEIKPSCLDLETMVFKHVPDFTIRPWVEYEFSVRITANNDFVAIFTGQDVVIWSAFHRGNSAAVLPQFGAPVSAVALHPLTNQLVVTSETRIHYFQSAEMFQEDKMNENTEEGSSSGE
ncbi:hypothetical protein GCK72_022299 [Caenorhabditis remanei]|uniref:F-box domain-containing protein n=1 Tax=Caenorhabditis remanei TaxID=31234 RepID=A0A6A5FTG0_CAERE|nr:hypothetical protein GCK72_022299 [Caenorhabditis remanei]KAF1745852.1 hypothetical protein GCK72_022299 [Caenorhabditis remanei]